MNKVDIKGGQMTFGQRIELGRIVTDQSLSEYEKFKRCMLCLDENWRVTTLHPGLKYWYEVLEGLQYWVQREQAELKYNPTPDELTAGIEVLSMRVGEMSTLMALAKDYSKDPDEILEWKYGKVFNILYTNLQSHLFRERLDKRLAEKAKADSRKGRMGKR